jgi:hypothetical protein
MCIKSKLFSFDGLPCYLEGTGEPNAIGQMTFSLITWIGRLSKDDPENSVWCHVHGIVLSGCTLSLYSDIDSMGGAPNLYSEITIDNEYVDKIFLGDWGLKSAEEIIRLLASDPRTKIQYYQTCSFINASGDRFDESKWMQKMGSYTADELQ